MGPQQPAGPSPSQPVGSSCAKYGCSGGYVPGRPCQCTASCRQHGNCCVDFDAICSAPHHKATPRPTPDPTPRPGLCQDFGCGKYQPGRACQCNDGCEGHGNCCSDFFRVCRAKCDAHPKCKALHLWDKDCCPTTSGTYLDCCR